MARRPAHRRPRAPRAAATNTIRLIGGVWRGRRVPVTHGDGLRPTPDRVRETLFNWLAPRIEGARCVDLFAGTGALGLEALSRGAAHVSFVDRDAGAATHIREALTTLGASERAQVWHADALDVASLDAAFRSSPDIVFIDPPFAARLHAAALDRILARLPAHARIYLEYPAAEQAAIDTLCAHRLKPLRVKRAGQVGYCLAQPGVDSEDTRP